jgi:glycosyltransferase involved in cell wall biosynthesis
VKVLFVIAGIGSVYGGPSKIVVELAQALGKRGINVDIVTTNANGKTDLDVPLKTWVIKNFYRIQYFSHLHFGDYKVSLSLSRWLFKHVVNYDLVHTIALFSYPVTITHLACQKHQVPYINNPQGMLEPWALSHKSWKKKLYYAFLDRAALNRANAIHILNQAEANKIAPLQLTAPYIFIPNGLNSQDFKKLRQPDLFYQHYPQTCGKTLILFLARIDPKKGLDMLANAFSIVHRQFPDTHLIIAGPDNIDFTSTVQAYFAKAGCLDSVTFTGILLGELKYAALAAASLYVAPSYSEGFSMSVLEGMASGLPCVITTGCNFPEAGEKQAALVADIRAESIADALLWCLKNPQEANAMGDRARQLIFEHYTWDIIAEQLEQVYLNILPSNRS